jgi:tRNA 2-thiocytidine biosynthesis protein TtcA
MPPKLRSDDGRNIVIRPLAYCAESDLVEYAELRGFPVMPCNLCGSQENLERKNVKAMLADWDRKYPGRIETIFGAITNVMPSQLADTKLFDFAGFDAPDNRSRAYAHAWLADPESDAPIDSG